jgi:hypothetical protein
MHSPAQAILWQIFWRYRWGFIAAGAFLALAVLLSHLLPTHQKIHIGNFEVPAAGWFLGISCFYMNVMLVAPFSMHGGDSRQFDFARHLFVRPVRSTALVAWPMLSGGLVVAGVWLVIAWLVFRPAGIAAPLWMPAAGLALFLATFQALAWTPFVQRWMHIGLTVVVLMSPAFVVLLGLMFQIQISEFAGTAILLGLIPVAFAAAVSGVARARRGQPYDWRAWNRFLDWLARCRPAATRPFRSAFRAQLWYECRANLMVPVMIACMLPCFIFVPAINKHDVELGWRLLAIMLAAPPFLALLVGCAMGSLTDPLSKRESGTFILVRPISSLSIVRGKLVLAAMVTAVLWLLFLGYISLLLTRPGFAQSIAQVAGSVAAWKAIGVPVAVVLLLVLFTWKNMIESLCVNLTGRKWVEMATSLAFAGLVFIGVGSGLWVAFHPEHRPAALTAASWLVGLLLVMKLAIAVLIVNGMVQSRLVAARSAALMIATWLAAVVPLCAAALMLLPSEFSAATQVVPAIVLFIPFNRVAGAPLALEWNRHR